VPNLSVDTDSHSSTQSGVTLYEPVGGLGARVQQPATRVKFMRNRVPRADWRLVGRVTTAYQCDLTGHPHEEQVVKLGWPEVSGTPIQDEEAEGHIPDPLASEIPMTVVTRLIRQRLGILPQARFLSRESLRPLYAGSSFACGTSPPMGFSTLGCRLSCVRWIVQCRVFMTDAVSGHITLWKKGFHHRDISPGNMI